MSTTTLIVEVVIIGFQVLVWISLLVEIGFGHKWVNPSQLKDWATLISVAFVGVSYTLGIIFDNLTNSLFAPWSSFAGMHFFEPRLSERPHPGRMRIYIMTKNAEMSRELQGRFNQSRLLRATSLNILLIGVLTLILVIKQVGFSWKIGLIVSCSSAALIVLAFQTWKRSLAGYYFNLVETYDVLLSSETEGNTPSQSQHRRK